MRAMDVSCALRTRDRDNCMSQLWHAAEIGFVRLTKLRALDKQAS